MEEEEGGEHAAKRPVSDVVDTAQSATTSSSTNGAARLSGIARMLTGKVKGKGAETLPKNDNQESARDSNGLAEDDLPLGSEANSLPGGTANGLDSKKSDGKYRLNRTASQAAMMGWQSFSSDVSNQTTGSSASLEMLLNERQVDPEMMLLNLGFGGQAPQYVPTMARVPARFLKQPSQAQGVATPWLNQQEIDGVDSGQDGEEENISGTRSPVAAAAQPKRKPGGFVFKGICYRSCQGYVDLLKLFLNRNVPSHFFNTHGSKCYQVVAGDDDVEGEEEEDHDGEEESRNRGDGLQEEYHKECHTFQVSSLAPARQEGDQITDEYGYSLMGQGQNSCHIGSPQFSRVFSNTGSHPGQFDMNKSSRAPTSLSLTVPKMKLTKQNRGSLSSLPKSSYESSRIQTDDFTSNPNNRNIPVEAKMNRSTVKANVTSSLETCKKADRSRLLKAKSLPAPKSDRMAVQKLGSSEATLKARSAGPKTQLKTRLPSSAVSQANITSPFPSFFSSTNPATSRNKSYHDEQGQNHGIGHHSGGEAFEQKNSDFSSLSMGIHGKGQMATGLGDTTSTTKATESLPKVVEVEETESEMHSITQPETKTDAQMPATMLLDYDATAEVEKSLIAVQIDQMQKHVELPTRMSFQSSLTASAKRENVLPCEMMSSQETYDVTDEINDTSDKIDETLCLSIPHTALLDSSLTLESSSNENDILSPIFQELVYHEDTTNGTLHENESEDIGDKDDSYDWMEDDEEDSDSNEPVHDLRSLNEMLHRIDGCPPEIAINNALNDDDLKESDEELERDSDSPLISHIPVCEELKESSLHSINVNDLMLSEGKHSKDDQSSYACTSASSASYNSPTSSHTSSAFRNPLNLIDSDTVSSNLKSPSSPGGKENCQPGPCLSLPDELSAPCFSSCFQSSNREVSSSMGITAGSFLTRTPVVVTVRVVGDIRVSCVPSQKLRVTDSSNLSSANSVLSVKEDVTPQVAISKKPSWHLTSDPASVVSKANMPMSYKSEISSFSLKHPKSNDEGQRATSVSGGKSVSTHVAVFSTSIGCSLPSLPSATPSAAVVYSSLRIAPTSSTSIPSSSKADFLHGAAGQGIDITFDNGAMQKSSDFSELDSSFISSSSSSSDEDDDGIASFHDTHRH